LISNFRMSLTSLADIIGGFLVMRNYLGRRV
jgi:hypothetical protein